MSPRSTLTLLAHSSLGLSELLAKPFALACLGTGWGGRSQQRANFSGLPNRVLGDSQALPHLLDPEKLPSWYLDRSFDFFSPALKRSSVCHL